MNKFTIADWIQLIAAIAIVSGLLLVLYELKQGREIAGAQLSAQRFDSIASRYFTLMGENPSAVLAKACLSPESLTPEDQRVVDAYFNSLFLTIRRMRSLIDHGNFGGPVTNWQAWSEGTFTIIFGYPDGRTWWDEVRPIYESVFPEVVRIGDRLAELSSDELRCTVYFENWKAGT